jgi:hypothetical protein
MTNNRRQRRDLEKRLRLLKQFSKLSDAKKAEVRKRKLETGKQIHLQNTQSCEQYKQEYETKQYQNRIAYWQRHGLELQEATIKTDEEYRSENEKFETRLNKKIK